MGYWKTPEILKSSHFCNLPAATDDRIGHYFECETCGRDYVLEYDYGWIRPGYSQRKRVRRLMGVDEHCPHCGPRSYKQFLKDIEAQKRALGAVMVGYSCKRHELTHEDFPDDLFDGFMGGKG